jgi:predicted ribosome quality control (RQC) complex YloA/Tae2 family protein
MSFDALTLSAVRDELEPLLVDARLQRLVFVDDLSLAVEAFAPQVGRTNVLLSADLDQGRVQRIENLPVRGLERDTPFSLLARKYLRNARIRSVRQPRLERVFELDCEQRDASGQQVRVLLIVEAMGRRSNLVLVGEDGVILDAARRSPPSRNSRRPVLPHLPYVAPPPQDRLFPEELSADRLAEDARGRSGTLAKFLSDRLAGFSPLSGRELSFRATGAADTTLSNVDWPKVVHVTTEFTSMVDNRTWHPTVAFEGDNPLDFAPYALTHLAAAGAELRQFDSISQAISTYYARLAEVGPAKRGDPLAAERKALQAPLERTAHTVERRIAALAHQLDSGHDQRDPLRRAGELILTHQASLLPGATSLDVDGEHVDLNGDLTPSENAQLYFARYRKAREAEERVPGMLEEARQLTAHLNELKTLVELADGMDSVRALRREVGAATGLSSQRPARKTTPAKGPYHRLPLGDGWEIYVGTSAAGNAAVTFDVASADDLWLHARGVPGAHVILRTKGAPPPEDIVERAAQIAAWYSAARTAGAVEVDVALRRHVKKIPSAPPGLVRYANERTLRVTPTP